LKIGYFGLPLGAYLLIRDGHELDPCVLSPIEAPGRRRVKTQIAAERLVNARGASAQATHQKIKNALDRARPELLVSWFWTRLLPAEWLEAARFGGVGVHPSLLPRHRGPNPYFWTIDSGDRDAGVTLHALAPEYDTGAILLQRAIPVGERNAWQLARALDRPSLALLREGTRGFADGTPTAATTQREADATWAPEPTGRELGVEWTWTTERVLRRIRALSPVPGLAIEVRGVRCFITRARAAVRFVTALEPGEAAVIGESETLVIRTADGAIAVERAVLGSADESDDDATLELSEHALARAIELAARGP
jgi:methionyl-tRNA formyltransferase